jgi:hypothetical protein
MWIYVPQVASYPSAQAEADSSSDLGWQTQLVAPSVTLKGKHLPARSLLRACKTKSWMRHLFGLISQPSTASLGVESWIASLAATPAKDSPPWESERGQKTPATSGPTSQTSSRTSSQAGSSSRTSPTTSTSASTSSARSYESWASELKQASSARMKWGTRITATDSSYWGTPRVGGGGGIGNVRKDTKSRLEDQIVQWDLKHGMFKLLDLKVYAMTGISPSSRQDQPPSTSGEISSNKGQNTSRAINPRFGEWLMNWPPCWTDPARRLDKTKFAFWEMESSQLVRAMLLAYCESGYEAEWPQQKILGVDMFGNPILEEVAA